MARSDEKVECRTPTPDKKPTRIPAWKYDLISKAVINAVRKAGKSGLPFKQLTSAVGELLSDEDRDRLGSLGWHVTTVKLEMEVRGDLRREESKGGQLLFVAKTKAGLRDPPSKLHRNDSCA